ncbi:hypothetical protein BGZ60DRAFT_268227 [Tricladium varicosporioides]|nr:hypothetical protein BGZ60DRAFT_268227 [Hymenoscyphus varicosporioides]
MQAISFLIMLISMTAATPGYGNLLPLHLTHNSYGCHERRHPRLISILGKKRKSLNIFPLHKARRLQQEVEECISRGSCPGAMCPCSNTCYIVIL